MTVRQCPVCGSQGLIPFLRRRQVPVHQNLILESPEAARSVERGDLDLVVCEDCGFILNQAFDPSRLSYGKDYDNTQCCSAFFDAYLDGLAEDLIVRQGVRNSTIVEVGCGKGHFLRKLVSLPGANNTGFGFDPSYVGPGTDLDGRLIFRRCLYDNACTDVIADVVVCRHVIEHVADPINLLRSIRAALEYSPAARVFVETPCVEWILTNRVVWDFFYEHCSMFTSASLSLALGRAGFAVERVENIFGGQYLWLEARRHDGPAPEAAASRGKTAAALAQAYGAEEELLRLRWLSRLRDLKAQGPVALWGAGAKGATFANLVDPDRTLIDCVADLNPNKQGRYIPGSAHPIVAPAALLELGIKNAVLMNPNYREENLQLLAEAGIRIGLIDWSH